MAQTKLDGGAQPVDLGNGFRLTAPGAIGTVVEMPRKRAKRGPADPTDSPLDATLRATGMREVTAFTVNASAAEPPPTRSPIRAKRASAQGAAAGDTLTLEVPPPPDGEAQVVVAVDQDGAVSWHLPEAPARRRKRGGATQRFRIAPRFASGSTEGPAGRAKRGITASAGKMLLKVLVYPVTDLVLGPISEQFARKWETAHRPYGVRRFTPEHYQEAGAEPMTPVEWAALGSGRALLFIHGTFSTAHGAFGALPQETMRTLHARYGGRVFAVNVFTLSDDPAANARWLLAQIPAGTRLDVDIVCHSRGGLVARALAEHGAAQGEEPRLRVGRVVFIGAPNHGTPLADPDHMMEMIDRITSALNIAPTGAVTETLEAIVTAVKIIGHGALKSLEGLASMNPSGQFLARLNRPGDVSTQYFAVAADYTPPEGGGFFKLVTERAGDRLVDKVFGDAPNDLVVPTSGVSEKNGGPAFPLPAASCFVFPAAQGVMHTQYFSAAETAARLLAWLPGETQVATAERPKRGWARAKSPERGAPAPPMASPAPPPTVRGRSGPMTYETVYLGADDSAGEAKQVSAKVGKTTPAPDDEGTTIRRSPSISSPDVVRPGLPFDVVVDLLFRQEDPDTKSSGIAIGGLAENWASETVDVRVDSPSLIFEDKADAGSIVIKRNGPSTPARMRAVVEEKAAPDPEGNITVVATFYYKGRFCGNAMRAFPLGDASAQPAVPTGAGKTAGAAAIELGREAPKLTVVILPPDKEGRLYWRLEINGADDVPGLPARRTELCTIGTDTAAFAAGLYAQADNVQPGSHRALFDGIGEKLFESTPQCFRQAYWALYEKYGSGFPIQFISGEPYIPWELMRPVDVALGKATNLLAIDHPVGRWLLDFEGTMTARLPKGTVRTVAPDYQGRPPTPPLPAAQSEADMLVDEFAAQRLDPATHASMLALLAAKNEPEPVAVLHFAGHGEFDTGAANGSLVMLADTDLRVSEVRSINTQLGRRFRTFVVFNACEVGQQTKVLDTIGGWAEAFLHEQFSGFLAPLWPAYDEDASIVMREFFEGAVKEKRSIGEVVRGIREQHADESPTFLSYMLFGDVMAQFA